MITTSFLRRAATILAFGAATVLPASQLLAQQSFFFQFTSGSTSASGTINGTANGDGTFTATSATGTVSGTAGNGAMTLVPPTAPSGCSTVYTGGPVSHTWNNQFNPIGDPVVDYCGLLFTVDNGPMVNIYAMVDAPGSAYALDEFIGDTYNSYSDGTFTMTTTPEPSSIALLGSGLFGLVPLVRRKRKIA